MKNIVFVIVLVTVCGCSAKDQPKTDSTPPPAPLGASSRIAPSSSAEVASSVAPSSSVIPAVEAVSAPASTLEEQSDDETCVGPIKTSNFGQELAGCNAAISRDPRNVNMYTYRGAVFGLMGKLDDSIADSTQAIKIASESYKPRLLSFNPEGLSNVNPLRARALLNRGLAWKMKGDDKKAIEDFEQAIQSNPGDPRSWTEHAMGWNEQSLADQAATLYKDIAFSGDTNTSGDGIYEVWDVQKTRFGNLIATTDYEDAPFATIIFLNGHKVFEGDRDYVYMEKYFRMKDKDVILLSSGSTGTATPDIQLAFLIIEPDRSTHVVSNSDFVADFGFNREAVSVDKQGRILINLGVRLGMERVAEFDSGKLEIHSLPRKNVPLSNDECQRLYEMASRECSSEETKKAGCRRLAKDSNIFVTGVDMSSYQYISNQPGFIEAGFNQSCLSWCKGKDVTYDRFSRSACNQK